jgi:peptidoglycan/LPS O-acetylase OafA/YrhL
MRDYSLESLCGGPFENVHLGVDFFFIPSGFILDHVYAAGFSQKKVNARNLFIVAR